MKIFDAHAHLGKDVVFETDIGENDLLKVYSENKVTGALIQPCICRAYTEDISALHDRIHSFIKNNGSAEASYYGMISINPHFNYADIEKECGRCVNELGFNSIKLATTAYGCPPDSDDGMHIFEIAEKYRIPAMIHTGGGNFGDPMRLVKAFDTFKTTKFIIAHAGGENGLSSSIYLACRYENVYLEPSWINILGIRRLIEVIGPDKFMYSSDVPENVAPAIYNITLACEGNETFMQKIFSGTAENVFNLY